jgi:predicted deacetylase
MFYTIGINSCTQGTVCYNHLADPNNHCNIVYAGLYNCNSVDCIEFLMTQSGFRENNWYTSAMELNKAKEHIYLEVKPCDRGCNEQVY